jgi:hypothetical protein
MSKQSGYWAEVVVPSGRNISFAGRVCAIAKAERGDWENTHRPARPAICFTSGGDRFRRFSPSYFFRVVNTTLLIERFKPIPIASLAIKTSYPLLTRSLNNSACRARACDG